MKRKRETKREGRREKGKCGRKKKQPFNYFIGSFIGKFLNGLFSNIILK